ncbi:hypothetical protein BDW22DRAFT_1426156 [Trametopsis cervina]|nr:hypothetical protein BDW22DRAFT_1426156 [Trametopsis cervina]
MSSSSFRIDEAYLVGGWCAASLWGVFTCLLTFAIVQIVQLHNKGKMNKYKWLTAVAMFLLYALSTVHVSLALQRLITGFVTIQGPGTILYFADIGQPLNRGKDMIYITSMIIADSIVVWRCYAVWGSNKWVISLPIILILGTVAAGYGAISQYFLTNPDPIRAVNLGTAMFAVSLTTNVVVTGLTVGRIWWKSRSLNQNLNRLHNNSPYRTLLLLLIESGLVIAVAKLIEFTLFKVASARPEFNALYIIFDMIPQINGIMPTLIIITVNAKWTITDEQNEATVSTLRVNGGSSTTMGVTSTGTRNYGMSSRRDVFVGYKEDQTRYSGDTIPLGVVAPGTPRSVDAKV